MSSSPSSPVQGMGVDAFVGGKVGVVGVGETQVDVHGEDGNGGKEEVERLELELEVQPKSEMVETKTMNEEKDQKVEMKADVETEVVEVESRGGEKVEQDASAQTKGDDVVTPTLPLAENISVDVGETKARGDEALSKNDVAPVEKEKMDATKCALASTGRPNGLVKAEEDEGR